MAKPISSTEIPTMADKDPNKLFVCPYNKYHTISAKIYPQHVANCRKQYTGNQFRICPFNARHEFPALEYDYHIESCPDKNFIEKEITSVPAPNVPQVNHHPEWNEPDPTEDWDAEADQPGFSLSGPAVDEVPRTAYDVIEDYQSTLQDQVQALSSRPLTNGDLSGLSKAQKKNMKRAQKRREKKIMENGDGCYGDDDANEEVHEMNEKEKELKLQQIAEEYAIPGRPTGLSDAFVDWVSILNQYCQKNKINQPKYTEAPNPLGGFGSSVVVTTERFFTDTFCRTKKEAKHCVARVALLGLNIAVSTPDPCRAPHQRGGDMQRLRELEARKQLLETTIEGNQKQQRIIPGLSQPSLPSNATSRQPVQQRTQNGTERLSSQMAGINLNQEQNDDDEWKLVGRKPRDSGRAPTNNALRLAGRGRGRSVRR